MNVADPTGPVTPRPASSAESSRLGHPGYPSAVEAHRHPERAAAPVRLAHSHHERVHGWAVQQHPHEPTVPHQGRWSESVLPSQQAGRTPGEEDARLGEREQHASEWLRAMLQVTRSLLSDAAAPLTTVASAIKEVSEADFVLVILPTSDQMLMVEVAVGDGTEPLLGYTYARSGSISAETLRTGHPILVPNAQTHPTSAAVRALAAELDAGPLMFVPLVGQKSERGVLAIGRHHSRVPFHERDLDPAMVFADHATLALELSDSRAFEQRVLALEERDRITGELHDHVLQQIFATGLAIQAMAASLGPEHAERVEQLILGTDETIARIRAVIHHLNGVGPVIG